MSKKEMFTFSKNLIQHNEFLNHQLNKFDFVNKGLVTSLKFVLERIQIPYSEYECDDEPDELTPDNDNKIENGVEIQ